MNVMASKKTFLLERAHRVERFLVNKTIDVLDRWIGYCGRDGLRWNSSKHLSIFFGFGSHKTWLLYFFSSIVLTQLLPTFDPSWQRMIANPRAESKMLEYGFDPPLSKIFQLVFFYVPVFFLKKKGWSTLSSIMNVPRLV